MTSVNIVTSDRGWILERLAQELARNLPYVTFGDGPDPRAAIQYYMTFSSRRRRLSPIEVGYFAHLEAEGEAHDRFFATAREVEHCVCHARLYETVLREAGIPDVTTISPGVDLETFMPKLRIGVVGRTYHTGRKGEHIVASVMDIPEIEWSFTGEGWPGPALHLPAEALPDFYRKLDYVLVPALYEGGPMCVVEALACGTEVIGPAIGWIPEFPHVEFKVGDADDLRRVLLELVEKKRALRASVVDRSWAGWVEGHDRVFRALADGAGITLSKPAATARVARPTKVGLFMHGNEHRSQGGPSVRVPRLARELRENGTDAELRVHPAAKGFEGLDLVHVFNGWAPKSAVDVLRRARRAGIATVFSPIYLGATTRDLWEDRLVALLAESEPGAATDAALAGFRAELAARRAEPLSAGEAAPGFHAALREMVELSDQVILLSERERTRLAAIGASVEAAQVVRNPVDAAPFAEADPALFREHVGLTDFVLCVARLEARKNQALLAHALRDTGLPLVLVGHAGNDTYRAQIIRHGGPDLHIPGRLPPGSPLLASAFAASRVAVLASWNEGAPLAALEGAAAGASLVLSDESGESEYFGDRARYCDPGDPASIRTAVMEAWDDRRSPDDIAAQKAFIAETYSWDRHRAATQDAYSRAMSRRRPPKPADTPRAAAAGTPSGRVPIVFDVTTSAHHSGRWTGISRVEAALAIALHDNPRADIRFVTWNNKSRSFNEVPFEAIRAGKLSRLLAHFDTNPVPLFSVPAGGHYIVGGSGWMQNSVYAESVAAFAKVHGLKLTPIIHDIIPTKFPFWFNDGYAPVFEGNLNTLLDSAAHLVAISDSTRHDIETYAQGIADLVLPEISLLREGSEIQQLSGGAPAATEALAQQMSRRPFVLTVGAIHLRKNHRLLYDAWLKLADRMGPRCPQLVLVGGVAWNGHEVARALRGDPRLKDLVTILDEVDDHALDWLYRNCQFTVYPSLYEGWGLPVAESLRYGKLCIAADTSSVPEIAPGLVELVDPLDVTAWVTKLQFYAGSATARAAAERRIAEEHQVTTWADSAAQLLDLLDAATTRPPVPRHYVYGQAVDFADRFAASRVKVEGWHPSERWGCWSSATRCELAFALPAVPEEALVIAVQARALSLPGTVFNARILANGEPVARWVTRSPELQLLHAIIPAEVARRDATLRITIENAFLTPLSTASKTEDQRVVGLGLAKAMVAPLAPVRDLAICFNNPLPMPHRIELGRVHALLGDGAGRGILSGNWAPNGAWGMVCKEPRARLDLQLLEMPGRDLEVELRLRPVASADAPLLLLAMANGERLGTWTFAEDTPTTIRIPLPAAVRARAEPVSLDLVAADARAPQALGLGSATDPFGFGLIAITVRAAGALPRPRRIPMPAGTTLRASELVPGTLGPDWHAPEPKGVWSFGREATLPLLLPGRVGTTMLAIQLEAYRPAPGAERVTIEASIGGRVLARRLLAAHETTAMNIGVPAEACGPAGEADLVLTTDAAPSPLVAGQGLDERPLGIRLVGMSRAATPVLRLGALTRFSLLPGERTLPPESAALLHGEWFAPEEGGCWSRGEAGEMLLAPAADMQPGWRAFVLARIVGAPATVDIEVDGKLLDSWEFRRDSFFVTELRGAAARVLPGEAATVAFRRRDAKSPKDLGRNADRRVLGVMVAGVVAVGPDGADARAAALFADAGFGRHRALRGDAGTPAEPAPKPAAPPAPAPAPTVEPAPEPIVAPQAPPAPPPEPAPAQQASLFDMSSKGPLPGIRFFKWHAPEPDGRWSHADYAEIYLAPPPGRRAAQLKIEMLARVHGTAATGPAEVEVWLENRASATLDFPTDDFVTRTLEFDLGELDYSSPELCLRLRRPGAASPAELGGGDDKRPLGVMVQMLNLIWR